MNISSNAKIIESELPYPTTLEIYKNLQYLEIYVIITSTSKLGGAEKWCSSLQIAEKKMSMIWSSTPMNNKLPTAKVGKERPETQFLNWGFWPFLLGSL